MMGTDCERIFTRINEIKDALHTAIILISNEVAVNIDLEDHQIDIHEYIDENGGSINVSQKLKHVDKYVVDDIKHIIQPILDIYEKFKEDLEKLKKLEEDLFSGTSAFNNSYGSPWTEINRLWEYLKIFDSRKDEVIEHRFQKVAWMGILNAALPHAVDARWAVLIFHDYVQRGFDHVHNDNTPSITHKRTLNTRSIGNLRQAYFEAVNIKESPIDPF